MKITEFRKLIREEVRKTLSESIYVGQTVKVITRGMTHYNDVGEVIEQDGNYFTVEFSISHQESEIGYFHKNDLKETLPDD